MGNLKLFAKNDRQLQCLFNIVKQISNDIRKELGLIKCAKATFVCGKLLQAKNITPHTKRSVKILNLSKVINIWG